MGKNPLGKNLLTERLLRSWVRCPRKAWLDLHGDSKQRLWTAHRALQLDHQQNSFTAFIKVKPGKGITACEQGSSAVIGIRLKGISHNGFKLESHPSLLQKVPGESCWGNFGYRPVIARQGKRLTKEHKLALALEGLLLGHVQGSLVREGLAVSKTKNGVELETISFTKKLEKQLKESLCKLTSDLIKETPPPITADRRKCSICSWRGICNSEASLNGHLSEVSGIGARRSELLHDLGIRNISELAAYKPTDLARKLESFGEQHVEIAQKIIFQAKVQARNLPERFDKNKVFPEINGQEKLLIYDIESDPDYGENFLHGFMYLERSSSGAWDLDSAKYQPLLVLEECKESNSWSILKSHLSSYPNIKILHYGETEPLTVIRLAKKADITDLELKNLKNCFIDIHDRLRKHWRLPLNNYSLKSVAGWIGFNWSQNGSEGAKALLCWRQWKREKLFNYKTSSKPLEWIQKYNKEDCLATWAVTEWLLRQDE